MRYLRGNSSLKLTFDTRNPVLASYVDLDMAGDLDNRKSTSCYSMTFVGSVVSWQSSLQKCVALLQLKHRILQQ